MTAVSTAEDLLMGLTRTQRAVIEQRLLHYVQMTGGVPSASHAVQGARVRRQTGLFVFQSLVAAGRLKWDAHGYVLPETPE